MSGESGTAPNRVVVGVDGSAHSKQALRWAARVASVNGATIDAIMTWDTPAAAGWGYLPEDWDPAADAEKALAEALDDVFGSDRPQGLRSRVVQGGAAYVLLNASEGAEMLVVGSRGLGGFVGLLIGSVSRHCAEHAHCPVLVVHEPNKQ